MNSAANTYKFELSLNTFGLTELLALKSPHHPHPDHPPPDYDY